MLAITKHIRLNSLFSVFFASFINKKILIIKNNSFPDKYFLIPGNISIFIESNVLKIRGYIKTKIDLVFFRRFYASLVLFNISFILPPRETLRLKGLGFRVNFINQRKFLRLKLGYSHFIFINLINSGINFYINVKKNIIVLESTDRCKLGNMVSKIISYKKPDVYKGKGIWFKGQKLKLKQFKKK